MLATMSRYANNFDKTKNMYFEIIWDKVSNSIKNDS